MSEQMEKLIKELAILFAKPIATYHPTMGLIYPTIHKKLAAELAEEAIARTLNAVATGMPLHPWEVGRTEAILTPNKWGGQSLEEGDYLRWLYDMLSRDARLFIALSPTGIPVERPTGTGEEEP